MAAQFARLGWDASVQHGANQPEYDVVAVDGDRVLKISVKGSRNGSWGLTQSYLKVADYHGAVDVWLAKHTRRTVFCLVQFKNVPEDGLPRLYLATPAGIAQRLKESSGGRGYTILHENHTRGRRARAAGTTDRIPEGWRLTAARVEKVAKGIASLAAENARFTGSPRPACG